MEQTLTLVCKLQPTKEQVSKIEALLKAFADGCNYVNQTVSPEITNKVTIQSQVYQDLRAYYGLSANQAVRVCARVGANRKTAKVKAKCGGQMKSSAHFRGKPVKAFKATSADYDARIFAFREKDWTVSLTLLGCREHIKLRLGNYQIGKLKGRKPTSAQLCKHRDGFYYIHIQLTDEVPEPIQTDKVIGVDFGRRDIAVTSQGDKWDGQQITQVRDKFSRKEMCWGKLPPATFHTRAMLQRKRKCAGGVLLRPPSASKGTRTSRRRSRQVQQRLSGRERRFQQWINHNISKQIIQTVKTENTAIAIEDLTGSRDRTNQQPRNKTERRRSNSWSFQQLRLFLEYKGLQAGVKVIAIPPQYTSQTCHQCLHIGLRSDKRFKCGHCHWSGDVDLNGALNIAALGATFVNSPRGPGLFCSLSDAVLGLQKATALSHVCRAT